MVRIAAVGDLHVVPGRAGRLRPQYEDIAEHADLLLLAGDLTDTGRRDQAEVLGREFADLGVPTVAILGNHDYHSGAPEQVAALLTDAGIPVLDGTAVTLTIDGTRVAIGGGKGFGGGFTGTAVSAFGEDMMKAFAAHAVDEAGRVRAALGHLDADVRIALIHYAPVPATLAGEPAELFPWLGSSLLADAIDAPGNIDLALHGHAHYGSEQGITPGGVPVRNVARPVINAPYAVYQLPGVDRLS